MASASSSHPGPRNGSPNVANRAENTMPVLESYLEQGSDNQAQSGKAVPALLNSKVSSPTILNPKRSHSDSDSVDEGPPIVDLTEETTKAEETDQHEPESAQPTNLSVKKFYSAVRPHKRPYVKKQKRKDPLESTKWKCPHCPFYGSCSNRLKLHTAKHSVFSGFRCHLCTYSVSSQLVLSRHINRVHPDADGQPQVSSDPDAGHPKVVTSDPPPKNSGTFPEFKDDLAQLDQDVRNGFKELKAANLPKEPKGTRSVEDSVELGRMMERKEAILRRLAELPELKMKAEIDLRKLQCAALKMRMWVLQQPMDVKGAVHHQEPETIIEAGEELILQAESNLKAMEEEKGRLEKEKEELDQTIRLMEEKNPSGHEGRPAGGIRMEEMIAKQRCRILHYYAAKQRLALAAFRNTSDMILREQEETLKSLNGLLDLD